MKQYTSKEQTAKLIELGYKKPSNMVYAQVAKRKIGFGIIEWEDSGEEGSYSIGELIEMLPINLIVEDILCSRVIEENEVLYYKIPSDFVGYWCDDNTDLIDNLYDMIVKLKEEGMI